MSAGSPRTWIVQFVGSFALGILIGGIIAYIGNTELVNYIRPLAIVFFAGIAVMVGVFLYLDSWRRKALNSTLKNLRAFIIENKSELFEAIDLLRAKRMADSLEKFPRPKREHFDAMTRLIQVYAGMTTAGALINVSIASAAALLAAAMVSEQNKLIKSQNFLIDLQHRLERNRARASSIEYVDRRYYLFRQHEKAYPESTRRASEHYKAFAPEEQGALRKYWALVFAQWLTLGGDAKYINDKGDLMPSYSVWTDYLVPIVRETGRQRALVEALCVTLRDERWPADRKDFVDAVMDAMQTETSTAFRRCCRRAERRRDGQIETCGRLLAKVRTSTSP